MDSKTTNPITVLSRDRVNVTLARIDDVLRDNRRELWWYITLLTILFAAGIACLVSALARHEYGWSIPPIITTALLHWPLKAVREIRRKNMALAIAPELIALLPPDEAVAEIKKLLHTL